MLLDLSIPDDCWWVYLLECRDGSLYTGIAKDVAERVENHARGRGARYTKGRAPLKLLGVLGPFEHGEALKQEHFLRHRAPSTKRAQFNSSWFVEP